MSSRAPVCLITPIIVSVSYCHHVSLPVPHPCLISAPASVLPLSQEYFTSPLELFINVPGASSLPLYYFFTHSLQLMFTLGHHSLLPLISQASSLPIGPP